MRREIEFMFGRRIVSSKDCIQLSEEIFRITKARLNHNTLRRFFGLVKAIYAPSSSTMQILSNYCGFNSLEEAKNHKTLVFSETVSQEQRNLLNFLVNIFRDTPVEHERDKTFGSIVKQTILFLSQNPQLVEKFQSLIAKTKNGQDYYFIKYVQIDRLNSCFGNGLRFFLKERIDADAQISGHSLLVLRYWLTENQHYMDIHYQHIMAIGHNQSYSCNASGRYFAALLYHGEARGYNSSDIIGAVYNCKVSLEGNDAVDQIDFEVIIAEALILTLHLEEGLYYADHALKKLDDLPDYDEPIVQNLYLLQAWALYKKGSIKSAESLYHKIRPTAFNFLSKRMYTILYRVLTEVFIKNTEGTDNQQELLIKETGFTRLPKLMNINEKIIEEGVTG